MLPNHLRNLTPIQRWGPDFLSPASSHLSRPHALNPTQQDPQLPDAKPPPPPCSLPAPAHTTAQTSTQQPH